jgi:hypothetical protein
MTVDSVNMEYFYSPPYVQNTNLYDCCVSAFIFTLTSRTELLLFSLNIIANSGKNYSVTITVKKMESE